MRKNLRNGVRKWKDYKRKEERKILKLVQFPEKLSSIDIH